MNPILSNFRIILKHPKYSENIGSTARAMHNMGFTDLALVAPQQLNFEKVKKTATHESADIVSSLTIFNTLEEALSDCNFAAGTTARKGRQRQAEMYSPPEISGKLISLAVENRVALVFGPEDRGLQNEDLLHCDCLINIPTFEFSSINLAQSVMILCNALFNEGITANVKPEPRLAGKNELARMYENLDKVLVKTGYSNAEKPSQTQTKFHQLFSRTALLSREAHIINGLMKKILDLNKKQSKE